MGFRDWTVGKHLLEVSETERACVFVKEKERQGVKDRESE